MRSAANALILQCAAGSDLQGGVASNIGKLRIEETYRWWAILASDIDEWHLRGDDQLNVVLGIYEPKQNVQCRGSLGVEASSCRDILSDMRADLERTTFGPAEDPSVQQRLPYSMVSYKARIEI